MSDCEQLSLLLPDDSHSTQPERPRFVLGKFRNGDRVTSRWGTATVIKRGDDWDGIPQYLIKHDWKVATIAGSSDAPPGFGHWFSEDDLQQHVDQPELEYDCEDEGSRCS